jgi:hypothetical protein
MKSCFVCRARGGGLRGLSCVHPLSTSSNEIHRSGDAVIRPLILQMYHPQQRLLEGRYKLPPVERVD